MALIIIIIFISPFFTANFTGYSRLLGEETSRNHQAYIERPHRHHNIIRNKGCEEGLFVGKGSSVRTG